jgi:hypothetical protein
VWGYGLVALAVACLMFVGFALTSKVQRRLPKPMVEFASDLVQQSMPLFLLLIVVGWIVGLNVTYWDRINKGEVPAEYTQFAKLSAIMIGFEIVLLMKWLNEEMAVVASGKRSGSKGQDPAEQTQIAQGDQIRYVSYLMSGLNFVLAGMMTIVLKYFSTDG